MELTGIFKEIEEHTYTSDKCFLCGCILTDQNTTGEHVIPKWIQKRFNLWDHKLTLLNGTSFPYRNLTIPCCFRCNNKFLEPFEKKILTAFSKGYESFIQLDTETIFLWLGKIYFGIMYKELFVRQDIRSPHSEGITDPEYLRQFFAHFLFLQGIRDKHRFKDFFPASIFIFKTQAPIEPELQWDYRDSTNTLFTSIRMGEVGLISVLQDGQATQQFENDIYKYRSINLHPLQFTELSAQIFYKASLLNRNPKYMMHQIHDKVVTIQMPMQGLSYLPIFNEWQYEEYAKILSNFTGISIENINPVQGHIWTSLKDEKGNLRFIGIKRP